MNKSFFTTLMVILSSVFCYGSKYAIGLDTKIQATVCYNNGAGAFQTIRNISVDLSALTAQNDCVDANLSPLTDGIPDNGTTVGASAEAFPNPPGVVGAYVDVWYEYTVPAGANRLRITFTNDPDVGVPDEVVTIYDNTCGPPLTGERILYTNIAPAGSRCVDVVAGTVYKIRVTSRAGQESPFIITTTTFSITTATIDVSETSGTTNDDGIVCVDGSFTLTAQPFLASNDYDWATPNGAVLNSQTVTRNPVVLTNAGVYTVTVTDINGCSSTATTTIVVNPLPVLGPIAVAETSGIANNDANVCVGAGFTLTADAGFASYSWDLDGAPLAEVTNVVTVASAAVADDGVYRVTVTDANGCTDVELRTVNVLPNPVANNTTLRVCANPDLTGTFNLSHATLPPTLAPPYTPSVNSNTIADIDNGVGGLNVTYHNTALGAMDENDVAVNGNFANGTIIFARVENPATNCYTVVQVTLNTNAVPTGVAIQNVNNGNATTDFDVCVGDEINLSVDNGTSALPITSYEWDVPGVAGAPNPITFPIAAAVIATHNGVWTVTVTDANGCTATDQITITVDPNPVNDLCANAIALSDNVGVNGTTACATPFGTAFCGLNTTTSHTVFYTYTVPAGNTTNTKLEFTLASNTATSGVAATDLNVGLFTNCGGTVFPASVESGDLCNPTAATTVIECVAPGTVITIAVGSNDGGEGDFNITVNETNVGVPANDLCSQAINIAFTDNCEFTTVTGTTVEACPESFAPPCGIFDLQPTVWYQAVLPAGGIGFAFENLSAATDLAVFNNNCASPTPLSVCITTDNEVTGLAPGTYLIAATVTTGGGPISFDIKTIVPPANDLCANATVLSDNTAVNGTTACATAFNTAYCGLSTTTSHTVFYTYTVPAGNTTNTKLEFTIVGNTSTTGTAATDLNLGLFTDCGGTVYTADIESGDLCNPSTTVVVECVAPGTVIRIAVGSQDGSEGDFAITVNETNAGIPVNDLCAQPTNISFTANCDLTTVNGTTVEACPETFAGACGFDTNPTVWFEAVLPAGGVGFGFDNITGGANISVVNTNCASPTAFGACVTTKTDVTGLTPGTYRIIVRTDATGSAFSFDIKTIVPPANDLCANAVALADNVSVNGTTACATPFNTAFCGLSTTTSHTVFYTYTVPAGNTTNTKLIFTITPNTATTGTSADDLNIGLFTNCTGTVYPASVESGDLCNPSGTSVVVECVAPGTVLTIAIGSQDGDEGDFSINVNETNTGIPVNDLCDAPTPVVFTANCDFVTVNGTTVDACPELFTGSACALDLSPTVWFSATIPAGGVGFGFSNLTGGPNINILNTNCAAPSQFGGCITNTVDITNLTPGNYLIAVRTTGVGSTFSFDIKTIVPPANDLCANAVVLSDNTAVNGTTSCATPFNTSYCGLNTTTSHTVFYTYTVPASNTTNTNLTFTVTPNTATTGTAAQNDINLGLFTDCGGTVYNASVQTPGNLCTALGQNITVNCVAPGTVLRIAIGSSDGDEGDFSINVNEDNAGIPTNDLCAGATPINIVENCEFQNVTGTTLGACPETFAGGCALNNFPTVWYEVVLPTGGIGFGFEDLSAGLNIAIFNNACPNPTQIGACITANAEVTTGFTPGTYLIAVRNADPGTAFNFDIKTILFLANDDPCAPGFVPTVLSNATALANQNNSCATEDNTCAGGPVTNSLWYSFTLPAGFDRITINVTGLTAPSIGLYNQANPCNQVPLNEECSGDGTVEFNCLPPGTYRIMVGTTAANANTFSITATQGNNAGPANDICTNATPIVIGPNDLCIPLPFTSSTVNACPENLPAGSVFPPCNFNTEETSWYSFTAPGAAGDAPTMDFTYTGYTGTGTPFMNLFNSGANCTTLTPVETNCFQGENVVFGNIGPLTPGQTYLIGISSIGDTGGDFDFTVKFNLGPPNDDKCHNAAGFDLGTGGLLDDQTNDCAGGDYTISDCDPVRSENSVWYTFTVAPGSYGVSIFINGLLDNGNPLLGPLAAGVFEDGCGSNVVTAQECFNARVLTPIECLEPGTYDLQISTSSATAGEFSIELQQLIDDRTCPGGPLADVCEDAIVIPIDGVFCLPVEVTSCNIDACPEAFNQAGCSYNTDPTVWFEFTVDGNAESIDIVNMTAGFSYTVLQGDACVDDTPTAITNCLTAANTLNITVTGGATYYIVVSNPTGDQFGFGLIQNVFPENDDPDPSSNNPPEVLSIGGSHESSTCCALGINDGPGLDVANVSCSGSTHDGAVWYRYTTGAEIGFEVNVTPTGANPISGPVTVEVLAGSSTAPGGLFQPTSVSCGPAPTVVKVGCFEPGEEVWIKVASANNDCGSFLIDIQELQQCPLAEECPDATSVIVTNPTDPNCGDFTPIVVQGCLEAACPETEISACGAGTLPTVWFQVLIDEEAVQLGTSISSSGTWDPVWAIYQGGCGNLTPVNAGAPGGPQVICSDDDDNPDIHTVGTIDGELSYWIAVSGEGVIDDPNFTLNVWTSALCVSCIGEDGCEPQATWEITARSSDRPLDDPLFCQGEDVTVCISYLYDASETGVDWLHGLIPDFGPGWDMQAFDPTAVTVTPGAPEWADEDDGNCAPRIREQMPYLCTYTDPVTGNLKLCHTGCQVCPCTGPLRAEAPLPSGWFWNTNGGAGCDNDCSPSTHFGIGTIVVNINFCVDLKVRVFDNEADCNQNRSLRFNFQTTSDGVSGCWEDPVAECKLDFAQIGPRWEIDCERPPRVEGDDAELCTEGQLDIDLTNEDGNGNVTIEVEFIDNPNVSGESNHIFNGGFGTIDDYLVNNGANIETVLYLATAKLPTTVCPSPQDTFRVTIYPPVFVNFDQYVTCPENALPLELVPIVFGGSGNYTGTTSPFAPGYFWNTGQTTPTITVTPVFTETFTVTVTDDKGCKGSGEVEVEVKSPVDFTLTPESLELCGGFNAFIVEIVDVTANSPTYSVSWQSPPGLDGAPSGNQFVIIPGSSSPGTYEVSVTVIDDFGCSKTKSMTVNIGLPPQADLSYIPNPLPCGGRIVDMNVVNFFNPSSLPVKFTLLDCDGNILIGPFGEYVIDDPGLSFFGVDLSLNNCFRLKMQTLDANGDPLCEVVNDPFVIPLTTGTPVVISPAQSICKGNSITVGVVNSAAYNSFTWAPAGSGNTANITVTPLATTQYSVTATQSNGCSSVASVIVTVNDLPISGITGATTYCPGESTNLTASGGVSYSWQGPASFIASTASTGNINVDGTYTVTVTDANNCTSSTASTITQSSQLVLSIAPITICDNNVDTLDAGLGFTSYEWKDAGNVIIGSSQKQAVDRAGTYTVSVTQGSCSGTGTGVVTNNTSPTVSLPDTLNVCRLSTGTGEFPGFINFESLVTGISGTWFNTDNAPLSTANWANVDFTVLPAAGFYTFTFTTNSAVLPCIDATDIVVVRVVNCLCPNPAINFGSVCNSRSLPINLNGSWIGNVADGNWTVTSGSQPYPVITNDSLDVLGVTPGTYGLRYTYTAPLGTCPNFVDTDININGASSVSGSDIVLCNQDIGAGPVSVDLNTLLTNLVQPTPSNEWVQIKGNNYVFDQNNPIINVTGLAIDTLVFEYTTSASSPCIPATTQVTVRIRNCACPDVVLQPDILCNGDNVAIDLEDPSRFSVIPTTTTGTWSVTAPVTITNGKEINPLGVAAGNYEVTYTINGSLPNGCTRVFTKPLTIRNQPVAELRNNGTACSANTGNGATNVSLFSLLQSGFSTGGSWTQISPASPQLTIPNTANVDFLGQAIDAEFVFRYTVMGTDPCIDVSVDVMVKVKDCNCPDGEVDCPDCDLCNDNGVLDLNSTFVNPASIAPGDWTVTIGNTPVPLTSGSILDAMGLAAGTYRARYTLNPAPSGNCQKSDEFTFQIRNKATALVTPDTLICNGATGIETFNLTALLKNQGFGNWQDVDGLVLVNTNIDVKGLPEGTELSFTFVVANTLPCQDSRYPVTIKITNNCNCLPINIPTIPGICTNVPSFDLKTINATPKPGTWTSSNPAIIITNGVINLTNVPAGPYQLTYTLDNQIVGCPIDRPAVINISNPKSAGTARGAEYCFGATDVVRLADRLDGEDSGGTWTVVSGGPASIITPNNEFILAGKAPGIYVFKYAFTGQAPCPDDEEEVTIKINPIPVADAGPDKNIDCDVQTALLGTDLTSSGSNIIYEWKFNGDSISNTKQYTANKGGDYILIVRDTMTKCGSSDTTIVIQADDLPVFDTTVTRILCFGQTGSITLSNLMGGVPPYEISFDGGVNYGPALSITNLKSGSYKILVKDSNGCINDQMPPIVIVEPPLFSINLGDDFQLKIGQDSLLTIKGQIDETKDFTITWKANGVEIDTAKNKVSYLAKPEADTEYSVTATNENECIATDAIRITITRVKPECVPNIFTPFNASGPNDFFSINCDEVASVTKYEIYDRWGNLVFVGNNLSPSNPQSFWNGQFKGKDVVAGVYVYYIEMLFKDGSTEVRSGDVTVLR